MPLPRNYIEWDPAEYYQDPVGALTLALRKLRLDGAPKMPNGTTVKSVVVARGSCGQRRFSVIPPSSNPSDDHRAMGVRSKSVARAEEAAKQALKF